MTSSELTYQVVMTSDWHIGTGAGQPGGADRLVRRDPDGLPFLPAKTVTGVLRDRCELVASGLDADGHDTDARATTPSWTDWVDVLFGSQPAADGATGTAVRAPRAAALAIRPAHLSAPVRGALSPRQALRDAATMIRPGVKIDPASGRAAKDHLRFIELARAGMALEGSATIADQGWSDEQRGAARSLIAAGAAKVTAIGGKRRRGAGACRVHFPRLALDDTALATLTREPPPLPDPSSLAPFGAGPVPGEAGERGGPGWRRIFLDLELLTPVCAAGRTIGNLVPTLTHVPGATLLPAVLAALRHDMAGVDADARAGRLVVTDATLVIAGRRGRPAPTCLTRPKTAGTEARYVNRQVAPAVTGHKGVREGYVGGASDTAIASPQRTSATHNVVEDAVQRPTEAVGGLYTVEALAAGQVFQAELRLAGQTPEAVEAAAAALAGRVLRIGRSNKDDYGELRIASAAPAASPLSVPAVTTGERVSFWFTSAVLVRDVRLRPSDQPADVIRAVEAAFGAVGCDVSLTLVDDPGLLTWVSHTRRHEGWHRPSGLPRASLAGAGAGSTVLAEVTAGELTADAITAVEAAGIGERRAEGFGQVEVNAALLLHPEVEIVDHRRRSAREAAPPNVAAPVPVLDGRDEAQVRIIEEAAWTWAIADRASDRAASMARDLGLSEIRNAQLGRLREVFGRLQHRGDAARVRSFLGGVVERWPASATRAADHLTMLLDDPTAVWDHLDLPSDDQRTLCVADDRIDSARQAVWARAVRTVVVSAIQAARLEREDQRAMDQPS